MSCGQVCPVNCISFNKDNEGFLQPQIGEGCISCNKCVKACPILNLGECLPSNPTDTCYALISNNKSIIKKSSSGGAFTAIVQAFCDSNYVIFGALLDPTEMAARHGYVTNKDEINCFRRSKYIQSEIDNSFINVKAFLEEGKKVLFTGTPCQVAGLKTFLHKDYPHLLTVDIVCHGVPNNTIFQVYIKDLELRYGKKIVEYYFRERSSFFGVTDPFSVKVVFEDGSSVLIHSWDDSYMRGFLSALCYRRSCSICPFASLKRPSDITIADFWGIEIVAKGWNSKKGVSLLLPNTEKAKQVIDCLKDVRFRKVPVEAATNKNSNLVKPTAHHRNRADFFKEWTQSSFGDIIDRYIERQPKVKIVLSELIPSGIKKPIKNLLLRK